MLKKMCTAKIHKAVVTKKNIDYKGSIGIDDRLLKATGILPNEIVTVLNYRNAERFETYVIREEEDSGTIALYGPAAKLGEIGDKIIILSYAFADKEEAKDVKMKIINVDKNNKIKEQN
jgi:aspartate 1-decarboxylase